MFTKVMQRYVDENNTLYWEEIEVEVPDTFNEEAEVVPFEDYKKETPEEEVKPRG